MTMSFKCSGCEDSFPSKVGAEQHWQRTHSKGAYVIACRAQVTRGSFTGNCNTTHPTSSTHCSYCGSSLEGMKVIPATPLDKVARLGPPVI